ncbi:MAG: STAS domain-containing protein [Clostridia bacterium]|nr:STAS domain-containing protein [Clostridia bacterium]
MEIVKMLEGATLTLSLEGRLDTVTAPSLQAELENALDDVKTLVLDFAKLDYVSSAGLRIILAAQKKMNSQGNMIIRNVNETIMEVFDITGFASILTVE